MIIIESPFLVLLIQIEGQLVLCISYQSIKSMLMNLERKEVVCAIHAAKDMKGRVQVHLYTNTRDFMTVVIGKCVISVPIQLQIMET